MPRRSPAAAAAAALMIGLVSAGCSHTRPTPPAGSSGTANSSPTPPPTIPPGCRENTARPAERLPTTQQPPPGPRTATSLLRRLTIAERDRGDDFCRTAFGPSTWPDLDANGCSARQDTLRRQGRKLRLAVIRSHGTGCREVMSGEWQDAYTGEVLPGANMKDPRIAATIQVDHLVSLFNAWVSGARDWPPERRVRFANDTSVAELYAVSARTNFAKSYRGAESWRPAAAYQCSFARA